MDDDPRWIEYQNQICYPVEKYLLGFSAHDKKRLISAIISNAFLNEKIEFDQLKQIPLDPSLETIGDFILDFVIIDNFAAEGHHTAKEIDDYRQFYGGNSVLHIFAKDCLRLHLFIIWGPDEWRRKIWEFPETMILADRFEMLVGVIYLEHGIKAVEDFLKKHNFFQEIEKLRTK